MNGGGGLTRRKALAVPTLFAGCRSSSSGRQLRLVTAGSPATLAYVPYVIAQKLGVYRQHGLDLTVETVAGGSRALRSLLGGSADVVLGYFDHPVRITAQGRTVRSFVVLSRYPGNLIVNSTRTPKSIRRIEDLRGALVGIPDHGSQSHWFLNYLLLRHGIKPSEVHLAAIGLQASGVAALEQGKVDAWTGFDPGATRYLRRNPTATLLVDARTAKGVYECVGSDEYPGAVLYSTAAWLNRNPEKARRLASGIQQALRWIRDHSPGQIAEQVPAEYRGNDAAVYLSALTSSMEMYSPDGRMRPEAAETVHRVLAASLEVVRRTHINLAESYTNEFVAATEERE